MWPVSRKLLSNIAVANGVMLEPVVDGALEQLRPACIDPIEETVLDINSPVSDRTNEKTQLSGQCLLRGEMQKPFAGLLPHFLRYVHGLDSVCVQKIHTTSLPPVKSAVQEAVSSLTDKSMGARQAEIKRTATKNR